MGDELKTAVFPITEIKTEDGDDGPVFEGLLSTFDLDLGGDVIEPGAFKRTLAHWKNGKGRIIPLLDSHNRFGSVTEAIGKLVAAEEVKAGLFTRWGMVPDDEKAASVHRRLAGGFVDGMSIGYRPVKVKLPSPEEQQAGVRRRLKEIHLREGSVVLFPMAEGARVDQETVKSLLDDIGVKITVDSSNVVDASRLLELSAKSELSEDEATERDALREKFGASLVKDEGLSPGDPRRVAMDAAARDIKARGLRTRPLG